MSKYTSLTNIHSLYRWAVYLADKVGIKVEFFTPEPGKQPYSTREGIYIPLVTSMTETAEQNLRFYVLHECAHLGIGPDIFRLYSEKLGGGKHPIGIIVNILEDWRIEYVSAHGFKGDRAVIDTGRCNLLESESAVLKSAIATGRTFEDDTCRFAAIGGMTKAVMAEYLPTFSTVLPAHVAAYPPDILKHCDILTDNNLRDRLYALRNESDTWALAEDVYCWLWDKSKAEAEQEQERERSKPKPGESGESGESEGEGSSGGGGDDSESDDGEAVTVTEDGKVKVNWRVFSASDHGDSTNKSGSCSIDFGDCPPGAWTPYPPRDVTNKKAGTANPRALGEGVTTASPAFRNKVRQWLQAKAAVAYDTGHKSGSLRAGQLWRGGVPAVGAAEWNQRVFKRPAADTDMDSAVLLLVDCSGSMSGGKIATAASAAAQLTEVLKCVSVPVAVLGFTDMAGCQVFTFKDFRESVTPDVLLGRFAWVLPSMCGNSDADALLFANRYLIDNITATRKVLIVLSDGCPTDCYIPPEGLSGASAARMAHNGLKSVTTEIQDAFITGKSNVELLGIGIKDDSVRNYYRRCVVIERNSELEGTLLGVVKSAIV